MDASVGMTVQILQENATNDFLMPSPSPEPESSGSRYIPTYSPYIDDSRGPDQG
jgi:hypothetical protein